MTEFAERQRGLEDWTKRTEELWTPDAKKVVELLGSNDAVFVSGPNGSGKSTFLTDKIREISTAQGWQSGFQDTSWFMSLKDAPTDALLNSVTSQFKELPLVEEGRVGVVVLDEVGWLDKPHLSIVLGAAADRGYKKMVLIPAGTSVDMRQKSIAEISEVLGKGGKSSCVYTMDQKSLPDALYKEYLELFGVPNEVIDFVVANLPHYLRLLDTFRGSKTIDAARESWDGNYKYKGVTYEQYEEAEAKIAKYLANKETGLEPI
jgi:hypothetical protein